MALAIELGVAGALLHGLAPFAGAPPDSPARPLLQAVGWLAWAGAVACASRRLRWPTATPERAARGLAAALGTLAVVTVGALLRQLGASAGDADATGATDATLAAMLRSWPLWLSIVAFAIAPALGEEAFFRGPALQALRRRTGSLPAALASALAFAACHPARPTAAFFFGAVLGMLALGTGRVREASVAHATHNALGLWLVVSSTPPPTP